MFGGVIIGFAGGYGVRELISRRRRATAREESLRRQEEKRSNSYFEGEDVPSLRWRAALGTAYDAARQRS